MRLWLSKSSEVPIREQLETQIILGIVSNDLKAGQRLPSIRECARRYGIHSNTVSAAYRALGRSGWVEFRKGSGVYVGSAAIDQQLSGSLELDRIISLFLKLARDKGFSFRDIQSRLRHWPAFEPFDHFLLIESDPELCRILIAEVEEATGVKVIGISLGECDLDAMAGTALLTMFRQAAHVRASLPFHAEMITLRSRSVADSLQRETRPDPDALITIVSRWPEFLRWSRTILVAAGLDPSALSFRDARERHWQKGLRLSTFVITDTSTARELPAVSTARIFRIIAEQSFDELRAYVDDFSRRKS